jgi:hypothetical protein
MDGWISVEITGGSMAFPIEMRIQFTIKVKKYGSSSIRVAEIHTCSAAACRAELVAPR